MNAKNTVALHLIRSSFQVSLAGITVFFILLCTIMFLYSINASVKGIVILAVIPVIFAFGTLHSYTLLQGVRAFDLYRETGSGPWVRLTLIGLCMWILADIVSYTLIGYSVSIPTDTYEPKSAALIDLSIFCAMMSIMGWTFIPRIVIEKQTLIQALTSSHQDLRQQPIVLHAIGPVICLLAITISPAILVLSLIFFFPFSTACYLSQRYITPDR